jgi:enoyl-CoA hydratase
MPDHVLTEKRGPLTIISINRPDKRNAINGTVADQLRAAWLAFEADDNARVGILAGVGDTFSAGGDLYDTENLITRASQPAGPLGIGRLMLSKPTIAAVRGYAVAGGFELALWCDLCIADESAVFGFFERRFGMPMLNGGSKRLTQMVGLRRALDIIMTGRAVSANEAYSIGLASELVPDGEHLDRAIVLAEHLSGVPQLCLRNDRRMVYENMELNLPDALQNEARIAAETLHNSDVMAGTGHFRQGQGRGGQNVSEHPDE